MPWVSVFAVPLLFLVTLVPMFAIVNKTARVGLNRLVLGCKANQTCSKYLIKYVCMIYYSDYVKTYPSMATIFFLFFKTDSEVRPYVERRAHRDGRRGGLSHCLRRRGLRVPREHAPALPRPYRAGGGRRHSLVVPLWRLPGNSFMWSAEPTRASGAMVCCGLSHCVWRHGLRVPREHAPALP